MTHDARARSRPAGRPRALLVHSSDEMYGSDRMVLEIAGVLSEVADLDVWLPTDASDGNGPLAARLRTMGIVVSALELPILRRRYLTPRGLVRMLAAAQALRERIRSGRYDLVYLANSACLPVASVARRAGVPAVALHVQEQWGRSERVLLKALATRCTGLVAVSAVAARATGLPAGDIRVIPNTVEDLHSFAPHATPALSPSHSVPRYLVASRWSPRKGYATLLRAWELAGCPGQLVILGGRPALGAGVDVSQLVDDLVSLPQTVVVVGEVTDPWSYLVRSDAVVLPSDESEGLGLVLVEAASAGIPGLASRSGGPEEVIVDGISGWLFDPRAVDQLAALFARLSIPDLARAGAAARQAYETRFSRTLFRWRLAAFLEELLPIVQVGRRRA